MPLTYRKCKFCGNVAGIRHDCDCKNDRYWPVKPEDESKNSSSKL